MTGAPQLWIAGTRPFGPACVVVRATRDIYLNSTDDEGVPEEIDRDHLYGLARNPYRAAGEPLPPMPVAYGLGLGFDPPVVSASLRAAGEDDMLEAGMVLAVTAYVWEDGVGAVMHRNTVHVTDGGADVLTDTARWPT
ncbi:M24 family metallopeptidase [Mycobacterium sp. 050134]|uniref:M24 family metallopeptidase n=1 Tax=Mycobacterium sp. 050134 TaxID=3096111 RepID=UPI002ED83E80